MRQTAVSNAAPGRSTPGGAGAGSAQVNIPPVPPPNSALANHKIVVAFKRLHENHKPVEDDELAITISVVSMALLRAAGLPNETSKKTD